MRRAHSKKALRLEEELMHELSRILLKDIQDPRLEFVTISGARLNPDLSILEVLYTHLGSEEKRAEVQKGLESAQGFFKHKLSKRLKLRKIPELRFFWDEFLEKNIYGPDKKD